MGRYPPQPVSVLGPAPTLSPFFLLAQAIFESNEDGRQFSQTSVYKIQAPGYYPEESIQHSEHGESLKPRNPHYCFTFIFQDG